MLCLAVAAILTVRGEICRLWLTRQVQRERIEGEADKEKRLGILFRQKTQMSQRNASQLALFFYAFKEGLVQRYSRGERDIK